MLFAYKQLVTLFVTCERVSGGGFSIPAFFCEHIQKHVCINVSVCIYCGSKKALRPRIISAGSPSWTRPTGSPPVEWRARRKRSKGPCDWVGRALSPAESPRGGLFFGTVVGSTPPTANLMIDLFSESVITLTEAARLMPPRREGRPVSLCTIWRWAQHGVRGIRLETVYSGGSRMTSREALERFCAAITAARSGETPAPEPTRLPAGRRKQIERAQRELAAAGYSSPKRTKR